MEGIQLKPVLKACKIFTIALSLLHHNQCTTSLQIHKRVTTKVLSFLVSQREVFQQFRDHMIHAGLVLSVENSLRSSVNITN